MRVAYQKQILAQSLTGKRCLISTNTDIASFWHPKVLM